MGRIVRFRKRPKWTSARDYPTARKRGRKPRRSWWVFVPVWGAAALFGTAYGAGWLPKIVTPADPDPATASHDGPKVIVPGEADAIADSPGVRVRFGTCKWGGGSNCVVDGDTFYIGGEKVRIADIDAPETHDYRCPYELELGERAASRLRALLNSGPVTMTRIDRDRDVYGRLLRNLSVGGQDVGAVLVAEGLARWYAGGKRPWC